MQHQPTSDPLQQYYDFPDSELIKLDVKPSNLPQSGMGIFATAKFNPGEIIAEYYGSIMSSDSSFDPIFNEEDKMVQIDSKYCVISRGPASRANDVVKWEPELYNTPAYAIYKKNKKFPSQGGAKHNAKISIDSNQKAFLRATRVIEAGEEIYIDYGFEYWDFFYKYRLGEVK